MSRGRSGAATERSTTSSPRRTPRVGVPDLSNASSRITHSFSLVLVSAHVLWPAEFSQVSSKDDAKNPESGRRVAKVPAQAMEKTTSIGRIVRHGWAAYRRVMRMLQLIIILLFIPGAEIGRGSCRERGCQSV